MSIITISRGSYSSGKEIAEKVAQRLGYECIARDTIIEASEEFHIPEIKLVRAIHDAPSILERLGYKKEKYLAYIQEAFIKHMHKDNVVYHGLAGHFLLKGISHALKVRIIADMDYRVEQEMRRENISEKEALHVLNKDDEERRKWSQYLFGIDTHDCSLYDMVLHIKKITIDDAVNTIYRTVRLPQFQTTPESQNAIDNLLLSCQVKVRLIELKPDIEVSADDGIVLVKTKAPLIQETHLTHEMRKLAENTPGVKELHFDVIPIDYNPGI